MTCTCKDINGSLLDKCLGTCHMIDDIELNDWNVRVDKLMRLVQELVTKRLEEGNNEMREYYKTHTHEEFLIGIKEGIKIGMEIDNERR